LHDSKDEDRGLQQGGQPGRDGDDLDHQPQGVGDGEQDAGPPPLSDAARHDRDQAWAGHQHNRHCHGQKGQQIGRKHGDVLSHFMPV